MAVQGVIVVDLGQSTNLSDIEFSALGYRSIVPNSTVTGDDEDPIYPFSNVLDFRDNTKYSPLLESGQIVINISQADATEIDYFAFAVHNAANAAMSGFFEVNDGTGFVVVAEFSTLPNNKPFMQTFNSVTSIAQRITFNFTSKLFIGSINVGKAIIFGSTPSLGFQPGIYAPLDTVEQSTTDGGNFLIGRRKSKGFQTKASFDFIEFTEIDGFWEEFQNHVLDSKAIYFKWSSKKAQTIFGLQRWDALIKPTYVTSFHANIAFEINGYA